jgi:hypothetical protein
LLNENDIEPGKQHPYQTNVVTKDINGCAQVFLTIWNAYWCLHSGNKQSRYYTMCDWTTVFKERYSEIYNQIERHLNKNEQSHQNILNLMDNPNSSNSSLLYT